MNMLFVFHAANNRGSGQIATFKSSWSSPPACHLRYLHTPTCQGVKGANVNLRASQIQKNIWKPPHDVVYAHLCATY
eukprot:10781698-Karenia_brevis.AAC.1